MVVIGENGMAGDMEEPDIVRHDTIAQLAPPGTDAPTWGRPGKSRRPANPDFRRNQLQAQ
jgi:hypothetical protein